MNKLKIKGEELRSVGFPEGKAIGIAMKVIERNYEELNRGDVLALLAGVVQDPEKFLNDDILGSIAKVLIVDPMQNEFPVIPLKEFGEAYSIFGPENIEQGAIDQMEVAMKLPVTVAGALMPDAHQGYGLPIGGVLATKNAIIPYGVGVDIGCRMALSIYDIPEKHFYENESKYKRELIAWTKFGAGNGWDGKFKAEHEILDSAEFNMTPFINNLKDKAVHQLGSSGGGNHFVEFGIIEFENDDTKLNIKRGKYLALLTHSGSRGFGATVASHYTKLAKEICKLPSEAVNLAYLDLNSAEGHEYWLAMNLAGDYASACHEVIHERINRAIGGQVLAKVENHHNFAWKEVWKGEEVIVHRKGATPASKDVMGIIPGSMTAPGFLVRGKGEASAINSASHGAGRQMSRTKAIKNISNAEMQKVLKDHGVTLIGAGLDEAPMAYKNIETVMAAQKDLVDVVARFTPKMVRMADDGSRED
ncbi:MAG TPA: RtcB family protein [Bacteroidia bacterium]|nr:RtcB family protein [Bacteroidota bacterium]MBK8587317.1 RtcB family protein [Bacteroidota bacterium]HQW21884.1 RtcB family protein [Bacteroidia bacterium]